MSRLRKVVKNDLDFPKMKSQARFSSYRVSGLDFVETFKSRSCIFKQESRDLDESRILPFATSNLYKNMQIESGRFKRWIPYHRVNCYSIRFLSRLL